ncbi:metallophosphoesterase family protein [Gracilibacillus sp. YIM 98692]|uniref:metallophosphoesterase family protein n=1 Tax=Gracilibacillus sp. YIM 98692 TaxID=2663532 RepID=UPI0013D36776|nr:metallophosphoesterase family protein [Gracilibacillus sp. YIM 98692]
MKIAFISDIHGNAVALDAVIQHIQKQRVDKICVLGDIAYRGPEPKRALDMVQSLDAQVIKGNADEWVVRGVQQGEVPDKALKMMQVEQAWIKEQLETKDIEYLEQLPTELAFELGEVRFHAFHATPDSLFEVILPDQSDGQLEQKLMKNAEADIYLYGHIHKAYTRHINGKTIINLGSVGLPFDGIPKASYTMVDISDGISVTNVRVPYDTEKVCKQYEDVQYPNMEMMQQIIRTGRN